MTTSTAKQNQCMVQRDLGTITRSAVETPKSGINRDCLTYNFIFFLLIFWSLFLFVFQKFDKTSVSQWVIKSPHI